MKKIIFVFLFIFIPIFASDSNTYPTREFIQKACSSYTACLKSEKNCVVISTLINVMRLYYRHPEYSFKSVKEQLAILTTKGHSGRIRYLSKIAEQYLSKKINYDWIMDREGEEIYIYFILEYERFTKEN